MFDYFFFVGNIAAIASDRGLLLQTELRGRSVCRSVFALVTFVSPIKAAEPIEMPFGGGADSRDLRGPKDLEPCIRRGRDSPREGAIFGSCPAHSKALAVSAAEKSAFCDAAFRQYFLTTCFIFRLSRASVNRRS